MSLIDNIVSNKPVTSFHEGKERTAQFVTAGEKTVKEAPTKNKYLLSP